MTVRVADASRAGAVKHVCRWLDLFSSCLNGASQQRGVVYYKDVETRGAVSEPVRLRVEFVVRIADHDDTKPRTFTSRRPTELFRGTARSAAEKDKAEQDARAVQSVTDVHSDLAVEQSG